YCVAWNADFPSTIEMWMWRSCTLLVAATPVVLGTMALPQGGAVDNTLGKIFRILALVSFPLYPIARLFIITIPFTSLRALPPSAFMDVDWSIYMPHL
ncbi:hypothetical protein C8R44DRAFT_639816, partial [Mycena epipterygia]